MNRLIVAREKPKQIVYQNYALKNQHATQPVGELNLSSKRKQQKTGYREGFLFCGLILCLIIIGVSLISQYSRVLAVNYKIHRVSREISQLREEQEHLLIEVKRLSSLERIEEIAKNDLGLQYPEEKQWLFISARGD
ncbi:MAG: cell division protein FtsL [Dethiobacteria bacterium]